MPATKTTKAAKAKTITKVNGEQPGEPVRLRLKVEMRADLGDARDLNPYMRTLLYEGGLPAMREAIKAGRLVLLTDFIVRGVAPGGRRTQYRREFDEEMQRREAWRRQEELQQAERRARENATRRG